jgi:hypothetical protein
VTALAALLAAPAGVGHGWNTPRPCVEHHKRAIPAALYM